MKKRTLTVLVVVLVCTFLTACSKEIDTVTESVNEKESNVIKNPRNFLDVCMDAAKYGNSPDKDISKICKVV